MMVDVQPAMGAPEQSLVRRVSQTVRVILRVYTMGFRARLEYRADFAVSVLFGLGWQLATLGFLGVLLTSFSQLGELTARGVVLMYGIRLFAHGVYTLVFDNLTTLSNLIETGRMDGFLLRPVPVFLQVLLTDVRVNGLGDLAIGATTLGVAIPLVDLHWTIDRVLFLAITIVGAVLLEAALQVLLSCLLLRSPSSNALGLWVDELMSTFGNYPLSVFPLIVQIVFTVVIPVAFIAYFPTRVLLGLTPHDGLAAAILERCSPMVGLVLFIVAMRTWSWALRHYHSVGG